MLNESIMTRYFIQDPNINDIDEILRKYNNISNKKYEWYLVTCVLKLLTTTNNAKHIRINEKLNLEYIFKFSKNSILSRIIQDRYHFSHVYEIRIFFIVLLEIWHMITISNNHYQCVKLN